VIYTVVIKTQKGYSLNTSAGLDWWEARSSAAAIAKVDPEDIVAMIPGQHHSSLIFLPDGNAFRPLDQISIPAQIAPPKTKNV